MLPNGTEMELELSFETVLNFCVRCRQLGYHQSECSVVIAVQTRQFAFLEPLL